MSVQNNKKRMRGKKKNRKNVGESVNMVQLGPGTLVKPPKLSRGFQVPSVPAAVHSIFRRQLKYRFAIATTGAQTYATYNLYIWFPYQTTSVVAGTVTTASNLSTVFTDLLAAFQHYRVRRIYVQYESALSSTLSFPSGVVGMQPDISPTTVGGTASTYQAVNQLQNAQQIDMHYSTSFSYTIPRPTQLNLASNTTEQALFKGGWLPASNASNARSAADPGVITFCFGDSVLPAPLTTTVGVLNVVYDVDFLLPN